MVVLIPRQSFARVRSQKVQARILSRPISNTSKRQDLLGVNRYPGTLLKVEELARQRAAKAAAWKAKDPKFERLPTKYSPYDKPLPKVYPPPPSARKTCKDPIKAVEQSQLKFLDPNGSRWRLFSPDNPEAAKVGDILLVHLKGGDDFAGVCLSIRKRGVDTAILLRNQLTRVGVEMWFKIYSPNVTGMEVVQRRVKRARRARLYYMRQPKHDIGSVENVVQQYHRQRQALRSGEVKSRDSNSHKKKHVKSK